jgi:hypothetical protein
LFAIVPSLSSFPALQSVPASRTEAAKDQFDIRL